MPILKNYIYRLLQKFLLPIISAKKEKKFFYYLCNDIALFKKKIKENNYQKNLESYTSLFLI